MSIFTILTYAMLILVVATGVASLPWDSIRGLARGLVRELGLRRNHRRTAPRIPTQSYRLLRHRA